jgi:hypothetical protein
MGKIEFGWVSNEGKELMTSIKGFFDHQPAGLTRRAEHQNPHSSPLLRTPLDLVNCAVAGIAIQVLS